MKKTQKFETASGAERPKLSSGPRQYVDVNDLRLMLKLGLGLHAVGDPMQRVEKAMNGLIRVAGADGWVGMVLERERKIRVLRVLSGGKDSQGARAVGERIAGEVVRGDSSIGRLLGVSGQTPGRVLAVIGEGGADGAGAIHSVLRCEEAGCGPKRVTWIGIHRRSGTPFEERERRLVELFHSQSAWLMLRIAE